MEDYALLDCGDQRKLERFGPYLIDRPCSQAIWPKTLPTKEWENAIGKVDRTEDKVWKWRKKIVDRWDIKLFGLQLILSPTEFGHIGIFPEHAPFWEWMQECLGKTSKKEINVLNLFAYTGGATLACAKAGASVCHLDASKGIVSWAKDNAKMNKLGDCPIRWIADDVMKFVKREVKRGKKYDAIILDPPTFGRGTRNEVFKIEEHLSILLQHCRKLLSENPLFILLSCHTPGMTPLILSQLLSWSTSGLDGNVDSGEMAISGENTRFCLPCGNFARWQNG